VHCLDAPSDTLGRAIAPPQLLAILAMLLLCPPQRSFAGTRESRFPLNKERRKPLGPALRTKASGGLSELEAGVSVSKAVLGAGSFALPWAFAQGGWLLTSLLNLGACTAAIASLQMVCNAREMLVHSRNASPDAVRDYAGIARTTLGPRGAQLSEALVVLTCLGLCSAYLVFIASTVRSAMPTFSHSTLVALAAPVLALLAWMRQMRGVSAISALGTASVCAGIAAVSASAFGASPSLANIPRAVPSAFPKFWGSVAFLFFVHFSLPPIHASMVQPDRFMRVARFTFALCGIVANLFGLLGACAYGTGVNSVVVSELGSGALSRIVKALLVANLLCTFPLVARSAFEIIENWASALDVPLQLWSSRLIRSSFVFAAALGAIFIPSFGSLLGYIGGIALSIISLAFPPLILLRAKLLAVSKESVGAFERSSLLAFSCAGVLVMCTSALLG